MKRGKMLGKYLSTMQWASQSVVFFSERKQSDRPWQLQQSENKGLTSDRRGAHNTRHLSSVYLMKRGWEPDTTMSFSCSHKETWNIFVSVITVNDKITSPQGTMGHYSNTLTNDGMTYKSLICQKNEPLSDLCLQTAWARNQHLNFTWQRACFTSTFEWEKLPKEGMKKRRRDITMQNSEGKKWPEAQREQYLTINLVIHLTVWSG